ncbi:hypothetical protein A2U01_0087266, partial [Trifolium medium]|nr:hypothetical protein [Trifolium medium]
VYWIKCNTDGAALGCPGLATYSGIFRDSFAATLGCFAKNLSLPMLFRQRLLG